jgi:hypothetical protein
MEVSFLDNCRTVEPLERQSRLRESAQGDKWSFCLTAGKIWPANQEHEQETPPEPVVCEELGFRAI